MGYEEVKQCISLNSEANLSESQYLFVKGGTGDNSMVLAGDQEAIIGVLQDDPGANADDPTTQFGFAGQVCIGGVSKVVAGAAIAANAVVQPDAAGKAKTFVTGAAAGIVLEEALADGDIVAILLRPDNA